MRVCFIKSALTRIETGAKRLDESATANTAMATALAIERARTYSEFGAAAWRGGKVEKGQRGD